ncbi:Non-repetitive/WGA-negative nucleoporin family protein [Elsinoe ampelina]|uniref:Non-repetitive/WGA-negative nucleoporin family protein n=1 Tax=Elsinoe ampelina TaxID=302913 RepID=A0A6A6GDP2_9PEZI|nr:Non-repetitive/WGA-negative nucleoporin family protein [Elsinoe ampelina]
MSLTSTQTATPQRKLPGGYISTPAQSQRIAQPSIFRSNSSSALALQRKPSSGALVNTASQSQQQVSGAQAPQDLSPVARGARTINDALASESRYPELDSYVGQGYSAEYDLLDNSAWAPFQRVKNYDIPEQIFEQANQSQVATALGLFAEINHAYITIDSSLYLWDYTHPNPELIGYEDSTSVITGVALIKPRPGVFVAAITHLLVVASTSEITLIGVATTANPAGGKSIDLYSTRMAVPAKGISCTQITASQKSGRIFFTGRANEDVWELTYSQEERWFKSRCDKINHSKQGYDLTGALSIFGGRTETEYIKQLAVDDTRDLLYTLSSKSTIRVYHIRNDGSVLLALTRPFTALLSNIGHMIPRTDLLVPSTEVVSLSPIPATESSRLSLQLVTSSGCRIFLSATSGSYFPSNNSSAPSSMQVHHVKFPPKDPAGSSEGQAQQQGSLGGYQANNAAVDLNTRVLTPTTMGTRYPPGFSLLVARYPPDTQQQRLFLCAPDSGQIKMPKDPSQPTKYPETAQYIQLGMPVQDFGRATPPFGAAKAPLGFANELAVQFDASATEIAILSSSGVHTIRRRRLVDILAAAVRYGGDNDGREGEMKKFIRLYGRSESAASALAVACGQGSDVTNDERIAQITEPEVIDFAREMFIQHGGRPTFNENSVLDNTVPAIDNVRTSPRHEGIALYLSRIVRSIWKAPVCMETASPTGGLQVIPTFPLTKLQSIQRSLNALQEFLEKNRTSIEGLAGPEALGRVSTKQEEVTLQAEHRAMNSMVQLVSSIIEGIAFVLVLFDERVDEIVMSLPEQSRGKLKQLTFEQLFSSIEARDLAKELVKAIVNRNIASGANVDTVADALRRRCGSFCSADDVIIFKAQELVKRASEAGANSEQGRAWLNESLRLFQKVAGALSMEHLQWAVQQYTGSQFYAGAIHLCLNVAQESDRANRALNWLRENSPPDDARKEAFDRRRAVYDFIFHVINAVDTATYENAHPQDGPSQLLMTRREEAYSVINESTDEVFQTVLFDQYLANDQADRLLELSSPFVVAYLRRRMNDSLDAADLLWKYFQAQSAYLEAASVQLELAKSGFPLTLSHRISYLSRARTSASIRSTNHLISSSVQSRHSLLREISDLLNVAQIQDDCLQRFKSDGRLSETRRPQVLGQLDGQIKDIGELFNQYADQAGYHDICLCIYAVADHRNTADIAATWQALIEQTHAEAEDSQEVLPWESVASKVRTLAVRLRGSEAVFPVQILLPMLEGYAVEYQRGIGPRGWIVDLFVEAEVPYEALFSALEGMWHAGEVPFQGKQRGVLAGEIAVLCDAWARESEKRGERRLFGGDEGVAAVEELLGSIARAGETETEVKRLVERLLGRVARR